MALLIRHRSIFITRSINKTSSESKLSKMPLKCAFLSVLSNKLGNFNGWELKALWLGLPRSFLFETSVASPHAVWLSFSRALENKKRRSQFLAKRFWYWESQTFCRSRPLSEKIHTFVSIKRKTCDVISHVSDTPSCKPVLKLKSRGKGLERDCDNWNRSISQLTHETSGIWEFHKSRHGDRPWH